MNWLKSLSLLVFLFYALSARAGQLSAVTGRVDVLWENPQKIQLVPDIKVYPGEVISVKIGGSVDVDHEFGESRRCSWFGLHCWYEQWDRPHWYDSNSMMMNLLVDGGHVKSTGGGSFEIEVPLSKNLENFSNGVGLSGMLYLNDGASPTSRGPCIGRPSRCSQGALTLSFDKIDATARINALERILAQQRIKELDVLALTNGDFIDQSMSNNDIANESTIKALTEILTKAIKKFHDQIASNETPEASPWHLKLIDLSAYALKFSAISSINAAALRTVVTESYLARGDYAAASQAAPKMMKDATTAYNANKNSSEAALTYAKALRANASAWREKGAKNASTDLLISIALLDQASEVLWHHISVDGIPQAMSQINVDAARLLNLIRTSAEWKAADDRLVAAICFQMYGEMGNNQPYLDWVKNVSDPVVGNCKKIMQPGNTSSI